MPPCEARATYQLSYLRFFCCDVCGTGISSIYYCYRPMTLQVPLSRFKSINMFLSGQPVSPALHLPMYPSMAVIISAFNKADVAAQLPGFGVLVPSVEAAAHAFRTLGKERGARRRAV